MWESEINQDLKLLEELCAIPDVRHFRVGDVTIDGEKRDRNKVETALTRKDRRDVTFVEILQRFSDYAVSQAAETFQTCYIRQLREAF